MRGERRAQLGRFWWACILECVGSPQEVLRDLLLLGSVAQRPGSCSAQLVCQGLVVLATRQLATRQLVCLPAQLVCQGLVVLASIACLLVRQECDRSGKDSAD